nr:response regulator [Pedobacter sp. ASV2]
MQTIIVHEADPDVLEVIFQALTLEGFDVRSFLTVEEDFVKCIDQHKPQLILLDYRYDGYISKITCHQIKQRYAHLPVIALSSNYDINKRYKEDGFDGYIRKPFDLNELYAIIKEKIKEIQR